MAIEGYATSKAGELECMKIKLLLDEDVHSGLGHALRKRGYDAIHAQELDRKGRSDEDQLLFAIQQERCIIIYAVINNCA